MLQEPLVDSAGLLLKLAAQCTGVGSRVVGTGSAWIALVRPRKTRYQKLCTWRGPALSAAVNLQDSKAMSRMDMSFYMERIICICI